VGNVDSLQYVEQIFRTMGEQLSSTPRLILELVNHKAQCPQYDDTPPHDGRTLGEVALAFPDIPAEALQPPLPLSRVFGRALQGAVRRGQLPPGADLDTLRLALLNTFFGVPLWLGRKSPALAPDAYRRQLDLLWAGARVAEPPREG
jgi:hypothetical protein